MRTPRFIFAHASVILMVAVNVSCNYSGPPQEAEIDAVRSSATTNFKKAFDVNDENAIAAMFLEDADLAFPTSGWIKGRDAIRQTFDRDQPEGLQGNFEVEDIRFLDATTAIVNINAHFSGGKTEGGEPIAEDWDCGTAIMKKQNGEWKYAALRVMPMRMVYGDVRDNIKKSWDAFLGHWVKGDAEGSASYLTNDALNMVPGRENHVNRAGVLAAYKDFFANNTLENPKFTTLELDVAGTKAFEHGLFEQKVIPKKGKPYNQKGRYYAVWQLEPDGVWRIHRFLFNDMPR
jgi:uncharacterized protein (TIGR02246 family)